MDVRLAGSDPATAAVEAALSDAESELGTPVRPVRVDPGDVGGADLAVVAGDPETLSAVEAGGSPWVGVELGGVGGHPVAGVEAAIAGFAPGAGCFDCLSTRVAANDPETGDRETGPGVARYAGAAAGREALALLAGRPSRVLRGVDEHTRVGGVVEVPHAERTVLPVPYCDCDPGHERALELEVVDRDLETALERAELALDERVGAVRSVGEVSSFPLPYYLTTLSDTTVLGDGDAPDHAAGVDADWNRAFVKGLGEALERYSGAVYRTDRFRTAPPADVEGGVSPAQFTRPGEAPEVDPAEPIHWVPGVELAGEDSAWLPAEAVHFPPPQRRYLRPVTTGLGLGSGTVEAVLSGLYEVVERDAAVIAWYSTVEPLELAVEDERYQTIAGRVRSEGLSTTALLCTLDVDVPVVCAAVHGRDQWPRFATGLAADLDPGAAAADALAEATQNWMELESMGAEEAHEEESAIARYAEDPGVALEFLDAGGPVPAESVGDAAAPSGREELDELVQRVEAAGLPTYAASVTPRDVAAAGFEAVRVAVPGAQPLFVDVDRPFFGDRARSVPGEMGFEPALDRPPHPYP